MGRTLHTVIFCGAKESSWGVPFLSLRKSKSATGFGSSHAFPRNARSKSALRAPNSKQGLSAELCIEALDRLAHQVLSFHAYGESFASVQHCSVIPAAEGFSNLLQGRFGVPASQIHRHLAREHNFRCAPLAGHIR